MNFVQITVGTLDSGERTFDSFRVMQDGTLHRAAWSDFGVMIGISRGASQTTARYEEARKAVRRARSGFAGSTGRAVQVVDAVIYVDGKSDRQVESDMVPASLATVVATLQADLPLVAASAGAYVWTNPSRPDGTARDIDLVQGCDTPVAAAIDTAMRSGPIAVGIDAVPDLFASGANARRSQFGAYTAHDMIRFGIVRTRR